MSVCVPAHDEAGCDVHDLGDGEEVDGDCDVHGLGDGEEEDCLSLIHI